MTDLDLQEKRPHKPPGDPDSSGDDRGKGRRGRHSAPITINKWAQPLPKLDLPARVHLQKASKIKQCWELWSVNVALAMSTWNDIAVTYWHQVYTQSEDSYQQWRRSGMADRFAYEKRYLYGRKAPVPATCDAVEALLRHELLAHIPEWLAKKAGVLGCTSSSAILLCWKEIFPNEDATRFDLVDELYALPAKMPTSMFQFAAWLEDWMTKLVVADEVSAHIEPRRAMAVLMNVGKPLQTADNIFMTEWVAIFRESGLRDDVTVKNLQDACLKLVVLARARARELQVDQQVERAQQPLSAKTAIPTTKPKPKSAPASDKPVCRFFLKPDGCKNGDNCQYAHPRTNGKCLECGSESHNLQACTRSRRQQSSRSESVKPASKKPYAKPKGKAADNQGSQEKKKSKGKSKGKGSQTKPTTKSGDVDFDEDAQADPEDQEDDQAHDEPQEDDPEACLIAAATSSSESEVETDGMCDWSASECKDYTVSIATVACAASESTKIQRDTWEWRGPCCLVRVHRQLRRCLFTPTWKEDIWQGRTVQPQRITHVKPQDRSFLTPVIEHVKSVEYLKSGRYLIRGQEKHTSE